jgi:hypothetical protein
MNERHWSALLRGLLMTYKNLIADFFNFFAFTSTRKEATIPIDPKSGNEAA